ncbi:MAG: proton-conducting transporter membrane subunit [Gemmataceae bacterium]
MDHDSIFHLLGSMVVLAPTLLVALLGLSSLLDRNLSERATAWAVYIATTTALFATAGIFVLMLAWDTRHVVVELGQWVHIGHGSPDPHYHFAIKFIFDRLSVPFVALSIVLCGTIGAFANRYMHREPGYNRFFVLYAVFLAGMVVASLAGTIETLFAGWELVGLSSALLVAFFHDRPLPVSNGLHVWVIYRISDAALLLAAVVLHHTTGEGDFDQLLGVDPWPDAMAHLGSNRVMLIGILLIIAAAGKSALVPFSGWLPRAMEGPTPSSAVFYGALSVHLGAYLLLRIEPILDQSGVLSTTVLILGLSTAGLAALASRVQTDIKSALSYASLTQVGLIVAEIGLGWRYVPLVHLLGHACLRTLQFIRAPTFIRDQRQLSDALEGEVPARNGMFPATPRFGLRSWLYRFALERGYLDPLLIDYLVRPVVRTFKWCDSLEQRVGAVLSGETMSTDAPNLDFPVRKGRVS